MNRTIMKAMSFCHKRGMRLFVEPLSYDRGFCVICYEKFERGVRKIYRTNLRYSEDEVHSAVYEYYLRKYFRHAPDVQGTPPEYKYPEPEFNTGRGFGAIRMTLKDAVKMKKKFVAEKKVEKNQQKIW